MTLELDLYWSVRSPYSYLVTGRLHKLQREHDLRITVRPVYPHAVRDRTLAASRGPLWVSYFRTDIVRMAQFLGLPIGWPRPDPVVSDPVTGVALDLQDQPLLRMITHTVQAAEQAGRGIDYIHALTQVMWNPQAPEWTAPGILDGVASAAGLEPGALRARVESDADALEAAVQGHDGAAKAAGHWGVPLMVFRGEPFFGQDRFDVLVWRLKQAGLSLRP
jgi:2-hydroxychromene-2-carboxylate isomerase